MGDMQEKVHWFIALVSYDYCPDPNIWNEYCIDKWFIRLHKNTITTILSTAVLLHGLSIGNV